MISMSENNWYQILLRQNSTVNQSTGRRQLKSELRDLPCTAPRSWRSSPIHPVSAGWRSSRPERSSGHTMPAGVGWRPVGEAGRCRWWSRLNPWRAGSPAMALQVWTQRVVGPLSRNARTRIFVVSSWQMQSMCSGKLCLLEPISPPKESDRGLNMSLMASWWMLLLGKELSQRYIINHNPPGQH